MLPSKIIFQWNISPLKHTVSKTQKDTASLMKSEFVIKTVQGSNSLARRSVANTADDMLRKGNVRNQQKCSIGQNLEFQPFYKGILKKCIWKRVMGFNHCSSRSKSKSMISKIMHAKSNRIYEWIWLQSFGNIPIQPLFWRDQTSRLLQIALKLKNNFGFSGPQAPRFYFWIPTGDKKQSAVPTALINEKNTK